MGDAPAAPAISPKLLELDKEDVRSFPPGKVFGRTAALVFGCGAGLSRTGQARGFYVAARRISAPGKIKNPYQ
jgi:hypothetical protein